MPIVKQKNIKAVTTNNARAITSIIVPLREKNRPPQQSVQNFRNRTITMFLYPNVFCPISELPKTMHHIIQIWRNILNCNIRYQQKQDNLPSYLGVRDTCVKFSSPDIIDFSISPLPDVTQKGIKRLSAMLRKKLSIA